ncbi:chitobiase/beta-hexosaminidase C-terminal domain-containing protein [Candidatus Woesearchaeota archaeon]|nr:chitobiase/beta-hexosaminidase C-terminal domain-containing protein [Candidatus Woesearchaeota archaeon]
MNKKIGIISVMILVVMFLVSANSAPTSSATPPTSNGPFTPSVSVTLSGIDLDGDEFTIFYTTDGSDPVSSVTALPYNDPIQIDTTTTLKYYAMDDLGNEEAVHTENYIINQPPTVTLSANPTSGTSPLSVTFTGGCSDDNIYTCTLYLGNGTEVDFSDGMGIIFSEGTYNVILEAVDDEGESAEDTTTITVAAPAPNNPPVFDQIPIQTGYFGEEISFTVSATDSDNDPLTYSVTSLPDNPTIDDQTGVFTWTPQNAQPPIDSSTYYASFTVNDGIVDTQMSVRIDVEARHYELEVIVYEQGTTTGISGATVTITQGGSGQCVVSGSVCTIDIGIAYPGTVQFKVEASDYQTQENIESQFTQGDYNLQSLPVELFPFHPISLNVFVKDSDNDPVGGADVTIEGTSFTCTTARWGGNKGTCTISGDLTEGDYNVIAEKSGLLGMGDYYADTKQVNVNNNGGTTPNPLEFNLANVNLITVTFNVDVKRTGTTNPIQSVNVQIDDYYDNNNVHMTDGDLCTTDPQGVCTREITIEEGGLIELTASHDLYSEQSSGATYNTDGATIPINFLMDPKTVSINGVVVQQGTNPTLPIAGATVNLDGSTTLTATTGTDGSFTIPNIPAPEIIPGTHHLEISHSDFVDNNNVPISDQQNTYVGSIDVGNIELARTGVDYILNLDVKDSVTDDPVDNLNVFLNDQQIASNAAHDFFIVTQMMANTDYILVIKKDNYNDYTQSISTTTPSPINIIIVNVAPEYELTVTTIDGNTQQGMDSVIVTTTTGQTCTVQTGDMACQINFGATNPGGVEVSLSKPGYETLEEYVLFLDGEYLQSFTEELFPLQTISLPVTVKEEDDTTPIKNAEVRISGTTLSCETSDQGTCTISGDLTEGYYVVTAQKPGIFGWGSYEPQPKDINVDDTGVVNPASLEFNLVRGGTNLITIILNINVLGGAITPAEIVENAILRISKFFDDNNIVYTDYLFCTTDSNGACSEIAFNVEIDEPVILTATHELYDTGTYEKSYSWSGVEIEDDIEITLESKKTTVKGKIVQQGTPALPVVDATVTVWGETEHSIITDNNGDFSIPNVEAYVFFDGDSNIIEVTHNDYESKDTSFDGTTVYSETYQLSSNIEVRRAGQPVTFKVHATDKGSTDVLNDLDIFLNNQPIIGDLDSDVDIYTNLVAGTDYNLVIRRTDYTEVTETITTDTDGLTINVEMDPASQHQCEAEGYTCHDPAKYRCGEDENGFETVEAYGGCSTIIGSKLCCKSAGTAPKKVYARDGEKCGESYEVHTLGVKCIDELNNECKEQIIFHRCEEDDSPYTKIMLVDETGAEITANVEMKNDPFVFTIYCEAKVTNDRVFCDDLSYVTSPSGSVTGPFNDVTTGAEQGRTFTISLTDSFKISDPPIETTTMTFTSKGKNKNLIIEYTAVILESIEVLNQLLEFSITQDDGEATITTKCTYKDGLTDDDCEFDSIVANPNIVSKKDGKTIERNVERWIAMYDTASDADKTIYESTGIETEVTFKKKDKEYVYPEKLIIEKPADFCQITDEETGKTNEDHDDCICPSGEGVSPSMKYKKPEIGDGDGNYYCKTLSCDDGYVCVDSEDPRDFESRCYLDTDDNPTYIDQRGCTRSGFLSEEGWNPGTGELKCCVVADEPEECDDCYVSGSSLNEPSCKCKSTCENAGDIIYSNSFYTSMTCGGLKESDNEFIYTLNKCDACLTEEKLKKEAKKTIRFRGLNPEGLNQLTYSCQCGVSCENSNRYLDPEEDNCGQRVKYQGGGCGSKCDITTKDTEKEIERCLCPAYCTKGGDLVRNNQDCGETRPWDIDLSLRGWLEGYAGPIDPRASNMAQRFGWADKWTNMLKRNDLYIDEFSITPLEQHVCAMIIGEPMGEDDNFTRYPNYELKEKATLSYQGSRSPVSVEFPDVLFQLSSEKTDVLPDNTTTIKVEWGISFTEQEGIFGVSYHECTLDDCGGKKPNDDEMKLMAFVTDPETEEFVNGSLVYEPGSTIQGFSAINTLNDWDYVCIVYQTRESETEYNNPKYKCLPILPENYEEEGEGSGSSGSQATGEGWNLYGDGVVIIEA